jgi:hypothetical protein
MNKTRVTALTTIGSSVGPKGTVDQVEASRRPDNHRESTELGL